MASTSVFRSAPFGFTIAIVTFAFFNSTFTGCGSPNDNDIGTGTGGGGYGGFVNTLPRECTEDGDCGDGRKCNLSKGVDPADAAVAADASTSGTCATECYDERCHDREECSIKGAGKCEKVTCGRYVECTDNSDDPSYCAVVDHVCYPKNAACNEPSKLCPSQNTTLANSLSVSFGCYSGKCRYVIEPKKPLSKAKVARTIEFIELNGSANDAKKNIAKTYRNADQITFSYKEKDAHFVYVTSKNPAAASEIDESAIWAAAMPQVTNAKQLRTVNWSDGVSINKGLWGKKANDPPSEKTLYAMVFVVKNAKIIRTTNTVIQFRVGTKGFPNPGDACTESVTENNLKPEFESTQCWSPSKAMGCFSGKCRILCGGQGNEGCGSNESCTLQRDLGIWICAE